MNVLVVTEIAIEVNGQQSFVDNNGHDNAENNGSVAISNHDASNSMSEQLAPNSDVNIEINAPRNVIPNHDNDDIDILLNANNMQPTIEDVNYIHIDEDSNDNIHNSSRNRPMSQLANYSRDRSNSRARSRSRSRSPFRTPTKSSCHNDRNYNGNCNCNGICNYDGNYQSHVTHATQNAKSITLPNANANHIVQPNISNDNYIHMP